MSVDRVGDLPEHPVGQAAIDAVESFESLDNLDTEGVTQKSVQVARSRAYASSISLRSASMRARTGSSARAVDMAFTVSNACSIHGAKVPKCGSTTDCG